MSNINKHYIIQVLYSVGFMFCSGSILQTFLLQIGFAEQQVYLFNALIQVVQVLTIAVMTFMSGKIKQIKKVSSISYLPLSIMAVIFIIGAINPYIRGNFYITVVFIIAAFVNVGVGMHSIMAYILPYLTIEMSEYGKMTSMGIVLSGCISFALSLLHACIVSKFDYIASMIWFFILAGICFVISSITCFSMKEIEQSYENKTVKREEIIAALRNSDTYILLFSNFARGIATGIINMITVIAISAALIKENTSSLVNVIMQVAMVAGNLIYMFSYKKFSSKKLLILATVGYCVLFPLSFYGNSLWFFCIFGCVYLFKMIIDTAIPVIITEIIPQEQIGAYTSIRMLIFIGAQAVSTLLITPIISLIGYSGLLIVASVMMFICGFTYWVIAKKNKKVLSNN